MDSGYTSQNLVGNTDHRAADKEPSACAVSDWADDADDWGDSEDDMCTVTEPNKGKIGILEIHFAS